MADSIDVCAEHLRLRQPRAHDREPFGSETTRRLAEPRTWEQWWKAFAMYPNQAGENFDAASLLIGSQAVRDSQAVETQAP